MADTGNLTAPKSQRAIPASIRRVVGAKIRGKGDWVRRSRRARDLLIARHGFRAKDFYEVTATEGDPTLGMHELYPAHFAGRRRSWSRRWRVVERVPLGMIVYNPGPDYWGEAGDDIDPICLLADLEFWAGLSETEIAAMVEISTIAEISPETGVAGTGHERTLKSGEAAAGGGKEA